MAGAPLPSDGQRAHAHEVQQQERELLQHSLSALYASMGAKEQELARAHAGRRRLRVARTPALTFALTFALTLP